MKQGLIFFTAFVLLFIAFEWLLNGNDHLLAHPGLADSKNQATMPQVVIVPNALQEKVDSIKIVHNRKRPTFATISAVSPGGAFRIEPNSGDGSQVNEDPDVQLASSKQLPEYEVMQALLKRGGLQTLEQSKPKQVLPPSSRTEKVTVSVVKLTDETSPTRVQNAFWWSPFSTSVLVPASIQTRITPKIFAGITLGDDEYGYIWGAGGVGRLSAGTQTTKLYVVFPVDGILSHQLNGMFGLGFSVDFDSYGGGLQFQKLEPNADEQGKQAGLYAYYSKTIDISNLFSDADLRWKVGPAFMNLRSGTDTSTLSLPYNRKTHQTMFLLYTKVEIVAGEMEPFPLSRYEMSLQTMIGTRKYFALTFAYNFNVSLGAEIMLASVLPGDRWNNDFIVVVGPKFRL